jgi:hypothetical protein
MKNLISSALAIFFAAAALGQIGLSPVCFMSWEKSKAPLKEKIGPGISVFGDLNKNIGLELRWHEREIWSANGQVERTVPLRTYACHFYFYENIANGSRWFSRPSMGMIAGFGSPVGMGSRMRQDLQVLKHPYFCGLTLGVGEGFKLSEKISLLASIREEAIVGMITDRPMINEDATSTGNLSVSLGMIYIFSER